MVFARTLRRRLFFGFRLEELLQELLQVHRGGLGRAVPCPPHVDSGTSIPLPMPDGGHVPSPRLRRTRRSARPTFPGPPMTAALWRRLFFCFRLEELLQELLQVNRGVAGGGGGVGSSD